MNSYRKCIYCGTESESGFRGAEHVIPQSFGTFGSETPTLDCVCDDCNAFFGRDLDTVLARETLEGVTRYRKGQLSSEKRRQKRLSITLGDDPALGVFGGAAVSIDGTTGVLMAPVAQFHAYNFATGKTDIFLRHQIAGLVLPEEIYGKPGKDGVKGSWKTKILAPSKEEHDTLIEALRDAGIDFQPGPRLPAPFLETPPAPDGRVEVAIEGEIDDIQKRAMAKILMNFAAKYLGVTEVRKPRWNFLRRYVRWGEGKIRMRLSQKPFWDGVETDEMRLSDDSINVRLETHDGNIIGVLQFYNLYTYEMILIERDTLAPEMEIAYRFTPGRPPIQGFRGARPTSVE